MLDTQVLLDSPAPHANVLSTPFTCSWTNTGDDVAWVRVGGELDISTSPQLQRTLSEARGRASLVVVDLRGVAFVDSSALHVVVGATTRARGEGRRLVILRAPPHVDRIFVLSEMCHDLEFADLAAVGEQDCDTHGTR